VKLRRQMSYWNTIQEELHRRCRQGISPFRAVADLLLSPPFRSSPFAQWDSPERLFRDAQALYQEWRHQPTLVPDNLAKVDTLRQQGILALMQPDATPCMRRR
jgi:cyclase